MPRVLNSSRFVSDGLRYYESPEYCFESAYVRNTGAAELDLTDPSMVPVKQIGATGEYEVVLSGDEVNAEMFLVEGHKEKIAAGGRSQRQYTMLARGAAVVSQEGFPVNDTAGTAFVAGALVARIASVAFSPPIIVRDDSDNRFLAPIVNP